MDRHTYVTMIMIHEHGTRFVTVRLIDIYYTYNKAFPASTHATRGRSKRYSRRDSSSVPPSHHRQSLKAPVSHVFIAAARFVVPIGQGPMAGMVVT